MEIPSAFSDFAGSLDLSRSRISRPKPVVLICGGTLPPAGSFASLRDCIVRRSKIQHHLPNHTPLLAEEVTRQFVTSHQFQDLLELEKMVAEASDGVLLIVEGPGAIAELGAFSVIDEIRQKLFVAVDSGLHDGGSFISAGPLRYMEAKKSGVISGFRGVYRATDSAIPIDEVVAEDIVRSFTGFVGKQDGQRKLSRDFQQDKYCLVYSLLLFLRGCYLNQVIDAAALFQIQLDRTSARKILSLLELIGWVRKRQVGVRPCWFPVFDVNPFDAVFNPSAANRDVSRWASDINRQILQTDRRRAEEFASVCGA